MGESYRSAFGGGYSWPGYRRVAECGGRRAVGHGEHRRELERQFPGWEIWYVPREPDSATWCARPQLLIGADSPEDLAAAIRAAHSQVIPDSPLLAAPQGYPARVRRLRKLRSRPVLPGGARRRRKGGGFTVAGGRSAWRGRALR
jgi:hypothetical protein